MYKSYNGVHSKPNTGTIERSDKEGWLRRMKQILQSVHGS